VQPVSYQLSIRAPGQTFTEFATYTFPLSPASLQVEPSAVSSFRDTRGPSSTQGVTRVLDSYGLAPPIFRIEGTTGWDRHATDGYILTGLQSMQLLKQFLSKYEQLNQMQVAAGQSQLYSLEFYDYFSLQFWQIQPIGPQIYRQASDRPLLTYYRFRWAAIRPAGLPILGLADALANTLATPAQQAAINAARTVGATLVAYGPAGIASALP
jgi:hypothetical protein